MELIFEIRDAESDSYNARARSFDFTRAETWEELRAKVIEATELPSKMSKNMPALYNCTI